MALRNSGIHPRFEGCAPTIALREQKIWGKALQRCLEPGIQKVQLRRFDEAVAFVAAPRGQTLNRNRRSGW